MTKKTEDAEHALITELAGKDRQMSPQSLEAVGVLVTGEVPPSAVYQRAGRGGKTFSYVKHTYANRLCRDAFGNLWSYDVLEAQAFDDHSAYARVRLTMYMPLPDGGYLPLTITAIGAHEDVSGKMCKAFMVASAASRGLCKCLFRRFNVGGAFYDDEEIVMTDKQAWAALKGYGERRGLTEDMIVNAFKESGITNQNLVDRFQEAYSIVGTMEVGEPTEVPEELKGDPVTQTAQDLDGIVTKGNWNTTPSKHTSWDKLYEYANDCGLGREDVRRVWEQVWGKSTWLEQSDKQLADVIQPWVNCTDDPAMQEQVKIRHNPNYTPKE